MSGSLPTWIERVLSIESGPGEGTVWSLDAIWDWPAWVTLLFLVFAQVFVVEIYRRESRRTAIGYRLVLAEIRLVLVAIVLFMLAQFALSLQRTGLPYVVVLVDDSLSMTIVDRYEDDLRAEIEERVREAGAEELSRWNLARTLLTEREGAILAGIRKDYKLRVYFLTGTRPAGSHEPDKLLEEINAVEPAGETSKLGTAVRTVLDDLRGTAPAAIVLLSDGINTEGPALDQAAAYARRKGVPLFTIGLGDDQPVRDLQLSDLLVEEVVFVNDVINFEAKLTGTGFQGRRVAVVLHEQGKREVLAQTGATIEPDGQSQTVRLPYRPTKVGKFRYVLEVEALEGELQTKNNRQERTVTVSDEKIRVLLVQAYPSFEFRYLWNMLTRDSSIEVHTVLQQADLEQVLAEGGPEDAGQVLRAFPVRRDELFGYDVIILGDADPSLLSASMMQNLVEFVDQEEKGGALVCIAGPKYMPLAYRETPLARLMPIDLASARYPDSHRGFSEGFVVQPTDLGLASPQMQLGDTPAENRTIWENLPPLYWSMEAPDVKKGALVLAEHPLRLGREGRRLPLICTQYVGAGKVLFHATDETWRWRWRVGDVFFARYWVQTLRALCRSKLSGGGSANLTADRREYRRGESVQLRVRFADQRLAPAEDDGVTVVLEHQGHKTRRIKLQRTAISRGIFEALLSQPRIGSYHAWMAIPTLEGDAPACDFTVIAPPGEFERVQMDTPELQRAAETSKGQFYTFSTANRLLGDLPQGRQVPFESLPPKPLWNVWPLLLLFLILLITEWVLRKVGGMV